MIRVLVVDDDFMVARLHSTLVEQVPGFIVAGAVHSGNDAVAAVHELRPDLVLLDMYLPDLPGLEVLRELRGAAAPEEGPDVLVVTAARDAETVRGAQRGGAVHYIIKPFEGQLLQERLRRYAERRAALAALQAAEQGDVDRLFADTAAAGPGNGPAGTGPTPAPARLPKGFTEQTAAVVRAVLEAGTGAGTGSEAGGSGTEAGTGTGSGSAGLSASECAERSGLSRVSARRYLEYFVSLGTARVTLRYGTTGRPERRYHRVDPPGTEPAPEDGREIRENT